MSEEKPGFIVSQGRIALVLSLITLLGLGFQGSKFLLDMTYRLASLEEKWVTMAGTQKDVAAELRNLNQTINQLNIVLREVQVRQQNGGSE
jgi:hypothetical protein